MISLRANFNYSSVAELLRDINIGLAYACKNSPGGHDLKLKIEMLLDETDRTNWNYFRIPFVLSKLNSDLAELDFSFYFNENKEAIDLILDIKDQKTIEHRIEKDLAWDGFVTF